MKMSRSTGVLLGVVHVVGNDSEHQLWHNKGMVNRTSSLMVKR